MLGRVVSYDVEVRRTKDVKLTHPWSIVTNAKRVSNDSEAAAIDVLSNYVRYSKERIAEGMHQRGDDEGEGTWWILVGDTMYSVEVTFESEAARTNFAVFELIRDWPYPNPWGVKAVSMFEAVAEAYGLEWDDLSLAFSEEWSARYWAAQNEECKRPKLDINSEFGPMTSDILGESSLNMFKALIRLIQEWPHQEMLSQDPPAAVTNVAKHFGVPAFQLRHLFATFWFEYVEELTHKTVQAQRDAQLDHLEEVFAYSGPTTDKMAMGIQELVTIWGPESLMSEDDLNTVKRIAAKYDVNWAELYGEYVEEEHAQCEEEEF